MLQYEAQLAQRKAAADAMGVMIRDVKIIHGIPEYRPKDKPLKVKKIRKIPGWKLDWTEDGR